MMMAEQLMLCLEMYAYIYTKTGLLKKALLSVIHSFFFFVLNYVQQIAQRIDLVEQEVIVKAADH